MFKKILIANRGEIACRILRAAREMSVPTVSVYSEADKNSLHALIADEAVCIGGAKTKDSYLNAAALITAAKKTGADAIHPGYGFFAENAEFAELCEKNDVSWIGAPASSIRSLGDKASAKTTAKRANVPVIPGSDGLVKNFEEALEVAKKISNIGCEKEISNPGGGVLVKATAGGGGRGIRRATTADELETALTTASKEAEANFGDGGVYIEKFLEKPRHVEVQFIIDKDGNFVYFPERDCSIQRRRQKLIEETPSLAVNPTLRSKMGEATANIAKAVGYHGVGTAEFLLEDDEFYFMEVNARIQVEHTVTEALVGIDLVREQIRIAAGENLGVVHTTCPSGAAVECRINAECPQKDFRPSAGKIEEFSLPSGLGIRFETGYFRGAVVPPFYDNLVAKIITNAPTRSEAIRKMEIALSEVVISGIDTNVDFLLSVLRNNTFKNCKYDIRFVDDYLEGLN